MNNAGSFPVSPTPQKRVLTEAFPFLAHGGGTCGYLVMANLELLVWCFFVSFIANDYIFFSWPGDGVLFISFWHFHLPFFLGIHEPIFTSIFFNWLGTNHQRDGRFGPPGSVFFPSNHMYCRPPTSSFRFCKKKHGKKHKENPWKRWQWLWKCHYNWNFVNPIIYVEDLRGCCSMFWPVFVFQNVKSLFLFLFFSKWPKNQKLCTKPDSPKQKTCNKTCTAMLPWLSPSWKQLGERWIDGSKMFGNVLLSSTTSPQFGHLLVLQYGSVVGIAVFVGTLMWRKPRRKRFESAMGKVPLKNAGAGAVVLTLTYLEA